MVVFKLPHHEPAAIPHLVAETQVTLRATLLTLYAQMHYMPHRFMWCHWNSVL